MVEDDKRLLYLGAILRASLAGVVVYYCGPTGPDRRHEECCNTSAAESLQIGRFTAASPAVTTPMSQSI
jgi:hypothetical protein